MGGWTHDEARQHTVVERLLERCSVYAQDMLPCPEQGNDLPREYWCERCLAADALTRVAALADQIEREGHMPELAAREIRDILHAEGRQ